MIISIITYQKFIEIADNYNYLVENFKQDPIYDLQIKTLCANDEDFVFGYDWPGTNVGCDCSNSNKSTVTSKIGSACSANQTTYNCKSVTSFEGQKLYLWDNGQNQSINLCAKRIPNYSMFKVTQKDSSVKCSQTEKQCGGDQPQNKFCVPINYACPITHWTISSVNPNPTLYNESKPFGNQQIYFTRFGNSLPVSELRVTQGPNVCMDNRNDNLATGAQNYPFLKRNKTTCGQYDSRFIKFSETGEKQLFQLNQIYVSKILKLPGYSLSDSNKYGAYYRNYLTWKIDQRDKIPNLVNFQDEINNMKTYQVIVMIVNILTCITVSIILQISEIYNLLGKDVPCIDGEGDAEKKRILLFKRLFKYTFKAIQLPFIILALVLSVKVKNYFGELADNKVSDDNANQVLDKVSTFSNKDVYNNNLNMLIFLLIMIIIDVIFEVKAIMMQRKEQLNKINQIQPNQPSEAIVKQPNQSNQPLYQQMQQQPEINQTNISYQEMPQQVMQPNSMISSQQPGYNPSQIQQQQQMLPGYQPMTMNMDQPFNYGSPSQYGQPPQQYGQPSQYGQPPMQQNPGQPLSQQYPGQPNYQQMPVSNQGFYQQQQTGQIPMNPFAQNMMPNAANGQNQF